MREEILIALRKIIRAIDLHSKQLVQKFGLTWPQLLVLQSIAKNESVTATEIAKFARLSNATIKDILDRLEKKKFIIRERSHADKRRIYISLTELAYKTLEKAPPVLQERFVKKLEELEPWESTLLLSSLQRIASMMEAEELEAKPVLVSGSLSVSDERADEFLKDVED